MSTRQDRVRVLAVTVFLALLAAACGAGTAGDSAAHDVDVEVLATDDLRFDPEVLQVSPGERFALICEPAVNHNLVIDGEEIAACRPGERDTGTVALDPGEHEFVCTVPGHQLSMRGTLVVE